MKFLSIFTPDATTAAAPPSEELMAKMGKLCDDSMKAGTLVATGGLFPVYQGGARVRASGGKIAVIDGPFTESKELTAGFAILEAGSREHAIELVKEFLAIAGDGESDLRQIIEHGADCRRAVD